MKLGEVLRAGPQQLNQLPQPLVPRPSSLISMTPILLSQREAPCPHALVCRWGDPPAASQPGCLQFHLLQVPLSALNARAGMVPATPLCPQGLATTEDLQTQSAWSSCTATSSSF